MDVFKFLNPNHPTLMDQGQLINGLKTKLWIERYRDAGEFEFIANVESMVHKILPLGTLISHIESTDVMIVENHEISENIGQPTDVKITGRSFETFLEGRVVGSNKIWPTNETEPVEYWLEANPTWVQIPLLIWDHIFELNVIDPDDAVPNVQVITTEETGSGVVAIESVRVISRGDLYANVLEIMNIDDLGIKTIRPGVRSPFGIDSPNLAINIYKGQDISNEVAFSHASGEIENSDYLWSNKRNKNAALITGRWLQTTIKGPQVGYDRRMIYVDGSDIDSIHSESPTGTAKTRALEAMAARGLVVLAGQKEVALTKAEAVKNSSVYKYREHYDLGDIVTVAGSFSETAKMQITEHVEIEDETGQSAYPTFSAIVQES